MNTDPRRYLILACEVLARECYLCAAFSRNIVEVRLLEQTLHDLGAPRMSAALQAALDAVDASRYDAIGLAYGLCNNGIVGLRAPLPLVIPRAHDCITLLLGSKERYAEVFEKNPGTIYESSGWLEAIRYRKKNPRTSPLRYDPVIYQEYVEKYGPENADYLMETLEGLAHYSRLAFIHTPVGELPHLVELAREQARERGWQFEEMEGKLRLLQAMMDGPPWDEKEFLVLPPGHSPAPSYGLDVLRPQPVREEKPCHAIESAASNAS